MERTLKLAGATSNEIFTLRIPSSLLEFCDYDFTYFAKHSIELCNDALKSGTLDVDRAAELRREIATSHGYIEHNARTVYEKIVLDCWIDFICRRDNIGEGQLWNRFVKCKSDFEKQVFERLCDFRYNRDINQWVNTVRVQDYAKTKTDFIFIDGISSVEEAVSRRNYFDLMFSVTAREMGCKIEDLGVTKTFSVGRVPTAPFMFPNISKDIVRNVLADFDYSEDYSEVENYGKISDRIAMDAFARMKAGLPANPADYGVVRGKLDSYSGRVYMPCSLKAAIDLEIDAIIENGGRLCRCKRCGRYYLRDKDYDEDYCSAIVANGKSCLEIWREQNPKPAIPEELERRSREVTDKVYSRVGNTMSVKEYESWHSYLEAMKQKVINGEISVEELDSFLTYSLDVDITKSTPIVEVPKKQPEQEPRRERVVKPFMPERISRDAIPKPAAPDPDDERALKEGFFTSPAKERRKNEKPQISHIIRNGESLGNDYNPNPDPTGFKPFGEPEAPRSKKRESSPLEDLNRLEDRLEEQKRIKREKAEEIARRRELDEEQQEQRRRGEFQPFAEPQPEPVKPPVNSTERAAPAKPPEEAYPPIYPDEEPPFPIYDDIPEELKPKGKPAPKKEAKKPPEIQSPPVIKKVIKKNAAAISAYGKAAGAPVVTAAQAESEKRNSDLSEPFKDIGSIFDVLEQSETEGKKLPERVTPENAPEGIWTEERGNFDISDIPEPPEPATEPSELDMLKNRKRGRNSRTSRLYNAIMRDTDDNPNLRKK